MKMRVLTALYWLMGLMVGLSAFGHGFLGVKPVRAALAVAVAVGLFWMAFGIAAYSYQHNPFWLLFPAEGFLLLVATLGLRRIINSSR
jgi:hypothetical protein